MAPDTFLNARSVVHVFCVALIATGLLSVTQNGLTAPVNQNFQTPGYCMSEESGPTVYVSAIFDTRFKQPVRFSRGVIAREFSEYLKGRFDYSTTANYPTGCPIFGNLAEAQASKSNVVTRMRQVNKQVVEVDWKYVVDEELVAASYSHQGEDITAVVQLNRKPNQTYCLSDSSQGTLYTTGPIDAGTGPNLSLWYRGFDQHLREKYSFKGRVECNLGTLSDVQRTVAARIAGARAAGKKVVNTGWKYDPALVATNPPPAQRDDDPEPVPRPAPPNPSRQASDLALKEMPASAAFCTKDPSLVTVFNCDRFARVVYNYRMAHQNEQPETVASLVASNKLNCAECIDNTRVSLWVSDRGNADKLPPKVINCVTQSVIVTLYRKPEANHLRDFYNEAVTTCKK